MKGALYLSKSEYTGALPEVKLETDAFFIENACMGRKSCRALGWYADDDVIYIHEKLSDMESLFSRSLFVHEFVHFLQHKSGEFEEGKCEDFVKRENEAYALQQQYFVAYGQMPTIRPHYFSCKSVTENSGLASRI